MSVSPASTPDEAATGYDAWSKAAYVGTDNAAKGFDGRSWSLVQAATVTLDVGSGVTEGTLGMQLEELQGAVVGRASASLDELKLQKLANTAWTLANLGRRPKEVLD